MTVSTTTPTSNFQIFTGTLRSEFAVLGYIEGFEDDYKLMKGIPVRTDWPERVLIRMDPDFKMRLKLSDHLFNQNHVIIASQRLKEFFEKEAVANVEYLPISIFNHKKRAETAAYWIVHPIHPQDCIDLAKSDLDWNVINPEDVTAVRKLVLDEPRVAKEVVVFRAKHLKPAIFVRRDLAQKLQATAFTGIVFKDIAAFRC